MTSAADQSLRPTLASPWWIPFGSFFSLIVANGAISVFSFGVFIKPLEAEFGWDRGSISTGLALCALCSALSLPIVGSLMDRFGTRLIMVTSIILFALNIAAIAMSNVFAAFVLLTALSGVTGAGQGPIGYVKSISAFFDKRRGIATGIAISGTGVGGALLPQFAQWLITDYGWRTAYVGLAGALVALALPAVVLFVREPAALPFADARGSLPVPEFPGLSSREALASRSFWVLVVVIVLVAMSNNGVIVHAVSLLLDRGWTPEAAARVMVWVGLASLAGRLVAGYLLDRVFAPYVAVVSFLSGLVGVYLLASDTNVTLGAIGVGLTVGSEIDIIAFMTSRYFGLRKFGQLYGYLFGAFLIGTGAGPMVMGAMHAKLGGYGPAFVAFGVMLAMASALTFLLGAYAYPVQVEPKGNET